jgi:hypothetical protein
MREICTSGSEGGGANPIVSPYPYSLSFHSVSIAGGTDMRPLDADETPTAPVKLVVVISN